MFATVTSIIALTSMEIILGIDNLVFLSLIIEPLPRAERRFARQLGLSLAWVARLFLLIFAMWFVQSTQPLLHFSTFHFSLRDLFLLSGGLFLLTKAIQDIHNTVMRPSATHHIKPMKKSSFYRTVLQLVLMDLVFSFDSVLTAVGMTTQFWIMLVSMSMAVVVMFYASERVGALIKKYPTIKMLALSFLILIGVFLIADGLSFHIPRGYLYFAMGFALIVECLNIWQSTRRNNIC